MENSKFPATENLTKLMLKFSVPCTLSLLVNALCNIVDQIFVGNSELSAPGNAATGIVFPRGMVTTCRVSFLSQILSFNKHHSDKFSVLVFSGKIPLVFLRDIAYYFHSEPVRGGIFLRACLVSRRAQIAQRIFRQTTAILRRHT